ncbi:VOC family protein [Streptomyces sp. NPDC056352]|uniref:VOC family protein n=1 Tax=Streptomyces sp. NPDC056352 TaxID=3345791 RepID=UPI0035D606B2
MVELTPLGVPQRSVRAEDCDATFERIRAVGGKALRKPIDQPYSVRGCAFRDPSGTMPRFSGPRRQSTPAPRTGRYPAGELMSSHTASAW